MSEGPPAAVSRLWSAVLADVELCERIERSWTAQLRALYPALAVVEIAGRFLEPWRRIVREQLALDEVESALEFGVAELPGWQAFGAAVAAAAQAERAASLEAGPLAAALAGILIDAARTGPVINRAPLRLVTSPNQERSESGLPESWTQHGDLVGSSRPMRTLAERCARIARDPFSVLVIGETGSGKEVIARLVHELSEARGSFVPVNCAALPDSLIECELFGHVRGAFTGATAQRDGLIQAADGGTLLLDELPDLPLHQQAKLLRVLQEGLVRKLGSSRFEPVDVRVIAATNRDPKTLLEGGQLRRDLYYRLAVHELRVPPLREHLEDVPELAACFLARWVRTNPRLSPPTFEPAAIERLAEESWPGNVRQLEHVVYNLASSCADGVVTAVDVRSMLTAAEEDPPKQADDGSSETSLLELERRAVERALAATRGNKAGAARLLGITRKTLYHKIERHGLAVRSKR